MSEFYSAAEVLLAVPRLTELRLTRFVEARIVLPVESSAGLGFRRIDLARIELLCELAEEFDLDEDGLGLVISLVDQLHAARRDLRAICRVIATEPPEVRARIGARLQEEG